MKNPKTNKKKRITILLITVTFITLLWLNNTSLFIANSGKIKFLAHRGLAQTFDISNVYWDTNTACIIYEPEHPYLENTIKSIQVAFDYGADVVELDIQITEDDKLVVFHDHELSMRTDGSGSPSEYTMKELKLLDIGYGYTSDDGNTYPFRGKGAGLMPELSEVLEHFPDKELLIHMKSGGLQIAKMLDTYIKEMSTERLGQITVYGGNEGIVYLRDKHENLRLLSLKTMKDALIKYELIGFTGYIPKELHNMELHIPLVFAKFLWGWPNKFIERMESVNTRVVIVEGKGKWSEGFDDLESLKKVPKGYNGYIWTNRIDRVMK